MLCQTLPPRVILEKLIVQPDRRGVLTEVFRETWEGVIRPVQWNIAKSHPNVLRGVHAHIKHDDYIVLLEGKALIGLQDLRLNSQTYGKAMVIEMDGEYPSRLTIPPGVVHGFYFCHSSILLHAVSEYWDPRDELKCHWKAPELQIPWEIESPQISDSDAKAPSFRQLVDDLAPWQDILL